MDELAKRFAELAEKYGPTVADAAKAAAVTEAYSTIIFGILCLIVAALLGCASGYFAQKILRDDWDEMTWFPAGLLGIAALIFGAAGLWSIIDPWTWTTIYHPELWLAKKAFHI